MTEPPAGPVKPASPEPPAPTPPHTTLTGEQSPEAVSVWVNRVLVVTLLAAAVAFVAVRFGWGWKIELGHIFWLLAVLPGLAGIVNYFVAEMPRHARRATAVEGWLRALRQAIVDTPTADPSAKPFASSSRLLIDAHLAGDSQGGGRPRFSYVLFGAVALTAVFGLVAELSPTPHGIGVPPQPSASPSPAAPPPQLTSGAPGSPPQSPPPSAPGEPSPPPSPSASATPIPPPSLPSPSSQASAVAPSSGPAPSSPTASPSESPTPSPSPAPSAAGPTGGPASPCDAADPCFPEAILGLIFAGYGAYIYAVQILVGRINSGSVSGRFLVRLALQSAAALVIGVVAGQTRIALALGSPNQALFFYFVVGLFPGWARGALRRRASALLTPDEIGCESLPLCLVDGLDEDVADRLWEQGMNDVQHLATSDPVDLMLRTNYSPKRVLDWIDQAMLIQYVRSKIAVFRGMGVRGAIDLCVIYNRAYAVTAPAPALDREGTDANATLEALATKADLNRAALARIAASLSEDDNVRFVWLLWQNRLS